MFDMSWGEILVIGAVALIVIGPKDLPKALRTVGQMTAKIRRMAGEFQTQFNEAMREAELEDVRRQVADLNQSVSSATSTAFNPMQTIRDELKDAIERPATTPAEPATPEAGAPAPSSEPAVELPAPELPPLGDPAQAQALAEAAEREAAEREAAAKEPDPESVPGQSGTKA
jgi:sec-independent protein translocase protein TatB